MQAIDVSTLNKYIKKLFSVDPILNAIKVKGEISNFKHHSSGHLYFNLKDKNAKVSCIMFASHSYKLEFVPKDGMSVVVDGYISVYEKEGAYQIYCQAMQKEGSGDLYKEFERLKKELNKQGYFDEEHKKELPFLPQRIALVTSPKGAAVRDMILAVRRKSENVNILVVPVLVQGEQAPKQISAAIEYINKHQLADVIVSGRGGGSIEDLWAYNTKEVVKAYYDSDIPIISGCGHEIDFTLADLTADVRAATPTSAGEISIKDKNAMIMDNQRILSSLETKIENRLQIYKDKAKTYANYQVIKYPERIFDAKRQEMVNTVNKLRIHIDNFMRTCNQKNSMYNNVLRALNPDSLLKRGYTLIRDKNNKLIASAHQISTGDRISINFYDGNISADVREVNNGNN